MFAKPQHINFENQFLFYLVLLFIYIWFMSFSTKEKVKICGDQNHVNTGRPPCITSSQYCTYVYGPPVSEIKY